MSLLSQYLKFQARGLFIWYVCVWDDCNCKIGIGTKKSPYVVSFNAKLRVNSISHTRCLPFLDIHVVVDTHTYNCPYNKTFRRRLKTGLSRVVGQLDRIDHVLPLWNTIDLMGWDGVDGVESIRSTNLMKTRSVAVHSSRWWWWYGTSMNGCKAIGVLFCGEVIYRNTVVIYSSHLNLFVSIDYYPIIMSALGGINSNAILKWVNRLVQWWFLLHVLRRDSSLPRIENCLTVHDRSIHPKASTTPNQRTTSPISHYIRVKLGLCCWWWL